MELIHFSLFSGIGGFDLAAEWAGFRTIGLVEKNPYRQKVLRKYWPDAPLWEDIRDVTEESLKEKGILADAQFDGRAEGREGGRPRGLAKKKGEEGKAGDKPAQATQYSSQDATRGAKTREISSVTLVTGGFPCQGFSVAGKRRGKADDRYLWPEMFGVIRLLRPRWVLAENVAGIVRMALDTVLSDLESEGYSTQAFNIPACGANAPHRRERIWIVAHSEGSRLRPQFNKITSKLLSENRPPQEPEGGGGYVPDPQLAEVGNGGATGRASDEGGRAAEAGGEAVRPGEEAPQPGDPGQGSEALADSEKQSQREPTNKANTESASRQAWDEPCNPGWWESEPDVGRVADGVPHRVDRLSALGDAIVPQVAYRILKAIAEIEKSIKYS